MLIARVDDALREDQEDRDFAEEDSRPHNTFTDEMIDGLYMQVRQTEKKKRDAFVTTSKKVIITPADNVKFGGRSTKQVRPKTTKPVSSTSGRLFEYEKAQAVKKKQTSDELKIEQLRAEKKKEIAERMK